jgi:hypothetical protein
MCTVSAVPAAGNYIFTFNRDEQPERHTTFFIATQQLAHKQIYFAQDSKCGGSWFAADNLGNMIMLFNGAFKKHAKEKTYTKSRGIILLEIAAAEKMLVHFSNTVLTGVEPFSIILFENKKLYRLTWDGAAKHETELPQDVATIFSSATLYDDTVQAQRRQWLQDYLQKVAVVNNNTVFDFHAGYNKADVQNGLVINRPGSCSTLSISQAVVTADNTLLTHYDLKTGATYKQLILRN